MLANNTKDDQVPCETHDGSTPILVANMASTTIVENVDSLEVENMDIRCKASMINDDTIINNFGAPPEAMHDSSPVYISSMALGDVQLVEGPKSKHQH